MTEDEVLDKLELFKKALIDKNNKIATLSKEIENSSEERSKDKTLISELSNENEKLLEKVSSLEENLANEKSEKEKLARELDGSNSNKEELLSKVNSLLSENSSLKDNQSLLEKKRTAIEESVESLLSEIDTVSETDPRDKAIETLESELKAQKEMYSNLMRKAIRYLKSAHKKKLKRTISNEQ